MKACLTLCALQLNCFLFKQRLGPFPVFPRPSAAPNAAIRATQMQL